MEEVLDKLKSLDNVQLRAELLKHGEKVGPVTPSTRDLFLSRLARKLHSVEHPDCDAGKITAIASDRSDKEGTHDLAADAPEPDGLPSTPTGRKGTGKSTVEKEMYYVVIPADPSYTSAPTDPDNVTECRVFTEKQEALAFMKKNAGSRLKVFQSSADVKQFITQSQQSEDHGQANESKAEGSSTNNLALEAEKSAFKGPKIQELVQFRKLVEKGDVDTVKSTVWSNPRYLITGADTPVVLHEGMRHNALHIAAKANQVAVTRLVLETVLDPEFTRLLYSSSQDTEESRSRRIVYLNDLYLNSPDKGSAETPLHIACKMGHAAVVQCLVMYSATDRTRVNKYGEKPEEIICSRYRGDKAASIKEEIQELLKGLCLVPLLRSVDNITLPVVGEPCSPDNKIKLYTSSISTPLTHSPKEPRLTLSAYAGPMSPSKARDFQKHWMNPRSIRNTNDAQEFSIARRADAEKGYERIGRKLAKELQVPWTEYWRFLDAFADFSTREGLGKLEQHLVKQQVQLAVLTAMEGGSSGEESSSCSSADNCGEDSQEECYYSCDEESEGPGNHNTSNCQASHMVEVADKEDEDVFEDSLNSFFDTRSYVFGQRLQLKKPVHVDNINNNDGNEALLKDGAKGSCEPGVDISRMEKNQSNKNPNLWSYRDHSCCGEEEKKASEASFASSTTSSFDASSSVTGEKLEKAEHKGTEDEKNTPAAKTSGEGLEKSFNTVMTELSEDLETKLIFSPEGKVVSSRRHNLVPDVGLCLGADVADALHPLRKRRCPVDVLIKSRKGAQAFLADVVIHSSGKDTDYDDEFSDSSTDDLPGNSRQVWTDVKLVTRNSAVFQYVRRLVRPVHLTVSLLETCTQDVAQHCGCVTARIARQKQKKGQRTACYIYGNTACKTDLDVMRAMCDADVDPKEFPAVHSWLSLVTAAQDECRDSWPSPAKLRHQHHLSALQKSAASSPIPISPLVQGGTVTSTPLSRASHRAIRTTRDLSPDRPALISTPRTWLFKSPT